MKSMQTIWRSPRFQRWGIPALIFLVAFLVRANEPISRPVVWGDRAFHFSNAVLNADWATTYQRYHPGVTLMWLSGLGLQIFSRLHGGLTPDQLLGIEPMAPGILTSSVSAAILPLALVIALAIASTYPLLSRLLDRRVALAGSVLLAFSPFHVTYSKVLHPDSLLSMFMLLSALCLLLFARTWRRRWLLLSGVLAGLSWLTKSPSLFLIPYALLVLGISYFFPLAQARHLDFRTWARHTGRLAGNLIVWLLLGAAVFYLLWPAMWVKPGDVLTTMLDRIVFHTGNPHKNPVFFAGQIWTDDPGIIYYLATIAFRTTLVALPTFVIAAAYGLARWRTASGRVLLSMLAYIVFFTIQMGLGEFKQLAYLLPVFPMVSLMAGFGLVWVADRVGASGQRPSIATALLSLGLIVQAVIVVIHHPYTGTHHNFLLGGTRVAQNVLPQQDQGEGLDIAARFLNELPHGQDETAMIYKRSAIVFQREFIGRTTTEFTPWSTYRIYYINQDMRGLGDERWQEQWEADQQTEPLYTVEFYGIPFVWVYGERPKDPIGDGPTVAANYRIGDHIRLHDTRISGLMVQPGEKFLVAHYWETTEKVHENYVVFNHLISVEDGQLYAQHDGVPLLGIRPVFTWRPGERLEDVHIIDIPESIPPGRYELAIGMYDAASITRALLFDQEGNPVPNNSAVLATIEVRPPDG